MTHTLLQRYYRPPFIGAIAFAAVFLAVPLAHSLGVVLRQVMGPNNSFWAFSMVGALALAMFLVGLRRNDEVSGTVLGYTAGILMWVGWASYAFQFNQISLGLPMADIPGGGRRPMNLLFIQGSIGICMATLVFFVFNKDTKCNAFRWIQRLCRIDLGPPDSGTGRNFCRITFIETLYVTWFCYATSLFIGDNRYLGYQHPVSKVLVAASAIWGLYLLWRLLKFTRVMAGIRYAIPTKAILWLPLGEFGPRYGLYDEIWLKPGEYSGTMWSVLGICLAIFVAAGFLPQRRLKESGV